MVGDLGEATTGNELSDVGKGIGGQLLLRLLRLLLLGGGTRMRVIVITIAGIIILLLDMGLGDLRVRSVTSRLSWQGTIG